MGEIDRIADRLDALASAVARGDRSELTMRIPAEPERDADLVMSRAAEMLRASRRCSDCRFLSTRGPDQFRALGYRIECLHDHWRVAEPDPATLLSRLRTAATCDDFEAVDDEREGG